MCLLATRGAWRPWIGKPGRKPPPRSVLIVYDPTRPPPNLTIHSDTRVASQSIDTACGFGRGAGCSGSEGASTSMTRPRPLESSAFVLVLGTLLAYHGGVEAVAHFQPHHVSRLGWVHRKAGAAGAAGVAAELVPSERTTAAMVMSTPSRDGARQSLGMSIATVLRGGRSMRQSRAVDDERDQDNEEDDAEEVLGEEEEEEEEVVLYDEKAVEWMVQQLCMYQTRTALISNPLAAKVRPEAMIHLSLFLGTRLSWQDYSIV